MVLERLSTRKHDSCMSVMPQVPEVNGTEQFSLISPFHIYCSNIPFIL